MSQDCTTLKFQVYMICHLNLDLAQAKKQQTLSQDFLFSLRLLQKSVSSKFRSNLQKCLRRVLQKCKLQINRKTNHFHLFRLKPGLRI